MNYFIEINKRRLEMSCFPLVNIKILFITLLSLTISIAKCQDSLPDNSIKQISQQSIDTTKFKFFAHAGFISGFGLGFRYRPFEYFSFEFLEQYDFIFNSLHFQGHYLSHNFLLNWHKGYGKRLIISFQFSKEQNIGFEPNKYYALIPTIGWTSKKNRKITLTKRCGVGIFEGGSIGESKGGILLLLEIRVMFNIVRK